jgi:hypothetical protein
VINRAATANPPYHGDIMRTNKRIINFGKHILVFAYNYRLVDVLKKISMKTQNWDLHKIIVLFSRFANVREMK